MVGVVVVVGGGGGGLNFFNVMMGKLYTPLAGRVSGRAGAAVDAATADHVNNDGRKEGGGRDGGGRVAATPRFVLLKGEISERKLSHVLPVQERERERETEMKRADVAHQESRMMAPVSHRRSQ